MKLIGVYKRFNGVQGVWFDNGKETLAAISTQKSFIGCKINVDEPKQV